MEQKQKILPHGDFKKLSDRLWILEGTLPHKNPIPRNMIVYKLKNGKLWIHSPIALDEKRQKDLENLGEPMYLVVPNAYHRLDARIYKETYPFSEIVTPQKAEDKVEDKVHVDLRAEEEFIFQDVKSIIVPGLNSIECVYELNLNDGKKALVVNDLIVNIPRLPGVLGTLVKLLGRIGKFRVPPLTKLLFHVKKENLRHWFEALAKRRDIKIITVSHGDPITRDIPDFLRSASLQI